MTKKSSTTKTTTPVPASDPVAESTPADEPVPVSEKKVKKTKKATPKKATGDESTPETAEKKAPRKKKAVTEPAADSVPVKTTATKRRKNSENHLRLLDQLLAEIEKDIYFFSPPAKDGEEEEVPELLANTQVRKKKKHGSNDSHFIRRLKSYRTSVTKAKALAERGMVQKVKKEKVTDGETTVHSGFKIPVKISEELATFIDANPGELVPRTEVTTKICKYIKENQLQNQKDKRIIIPDEALTKLLRYDASLGEAVTYTQLQKLLKIHYPSKD